MKCNECGFELDYEAENWIFFDYRQSDPTYSITSRIFDEKICEQIIAHALALTYTPNTIYIDTCLPDTHLCDGCFDITLKLGRGRKAKILDETQIDVLFFF